MVDLNTLPATNLPIPDPILFDTTTYPVAPSLPQGKLISMEGGPLAPLSPGAANNRADRFSFSIDKEYPEVRASIDAGQEEDLRKLTSDERLKKVYGQFLETQYKLGQKKQGPLNDQEQLYILQHLDQEQKWNHPDLVFESALSKRYMDAKYPTDGEQPRVGWYDDLLSKYPKDEEHINLIGKTYSTKAQIVLTGIENAQAVLENQSWTGWTADRLKNLLTLGLYGEAKMRGQVKGTGLFTGVLAGSNLEAQEKALWDLPVDQFAAEFKRVMDKLSNDNPDYAVIWAQKMLGHLDPILENVESAMTLGTAPGVGLARKLLFGATKSIVKSAVGATAAGVPANVAVPAAVGNVTEAAVANVKNQVSATAPKIPGNSALDFWGEGQKATEAGATVAPTMPPRSPQTNAGALNFWGLSTPTKEKLPDRLAPGVDIINTLPDSMNILRDRVLDNPGNFRELSNRLYEAWNTTSEKVKQLIMSMARVDTMPEVIRNSEALKALKDYISTNRYAGIDSHVLEISDPVWSPTGNWFLEGKLGRQDGTLFESFDELQSFANNRGILLKGRGDWDRMEALNAEMRNVQYQLQVYRNAEFTKALELPDASVIKDLEDRLGVLMKEHRDLANAPGALGMRQGTRWYLSEWVPAPIDSPIGRQWVMQLKDVGAAKTPDGFLKSFYGWLTSPDVTMSKDAVANLKALSYGPSRLLELAQAEMKEAAKATRFSWAYGTDARRRAKNFEEAINNSRTNGLFDTIGDLEEFYLQQFKERPTEREVRGYFAWKRYTEINAAYKALHVYTRDARRGGELHTIGLSNGKGGIVNAPEFVGRPIQALENDGNSIAIFGDAMGLEKVADYTKHSKKLIGEVNEGVKNGTWRILEVLHPEEHPLAGYGKKINETHHITQVAVRTGDVKTRPLVLKRAFDEPFDLDHKFAIKQAHIVRDEATGAFNYLKDKTILALDNRKQGQDILKTLNAVRLLIRDGQDAAAEALARRLEIPWDVHSGWYKDTIDAKGNVVKKAVLDKAQELHLTPIGKNIGDIDNSLELHPRFKVDLKGQPTKETMFRNKTKSSYIDNSTDPFEVFSIRDVGSKNNPLYKMDQAKYISAVPMMNRAIKRITNSTYMSDYKEFAATHWVRDAMQWLDLRNPSDALESPAWVLHNASLKKDMPLDIKSRLEADRYKIKSILGTPGKLEAFLHTIEDTVADFTHDKFGPKVGNLTPNWLLATLKPSNALDVARFMKATTFGLIMGLFSPAQLVVQGLQHIAIAALSPKYALQGAYAGWLHRQALRHPGMIDAISEKAEFLGFKPGEFKEAHQLLKDSGLGILGTEHMNFDDAMTARVVQRGLQQALDFSLYFFKGMEKQTRYSAHYTAYLEHRSENPLGPIGNMERNKILDRATMMAGNMEATSRSLLQKGPLSFTTQFLGYNLRMVENMIGHRFTAAETARIAAVYWPMFGVTALGLAGFPFDQIVREKAMEDYGYVVGDNMFTTLAMEGLPSAALYYSTGRAYNIGERFGSNGLDVIRDTIRGDKTFWRIATGPTGNMLLNAWGSVDGYVAALGNIFSDQDAQFHLTLEHMLEPLKVSNTGNAIMRGYEAYNTGAWLSRKGQLLEKDIGPLEAVLTSLTGVQPQSVAEIRAKSNIDEDRKTYLTKVEHQFIKEVERGLRAADNNDKSNADFFFTNARAILKRSNYPAELYGTLANKVRQELGTLADRTNMQMYIRNIPTDRAPDKLKTFQRIQELKQGQP
jgi:hypothetical protein